MTFEEILKTDVELTHFESLLFFFSCLVLPPIPTKDLKPEDVNELTTKVRDLMLSELKRMDSLRDENDSSPSGGAPPSHLGGVARWMSFIVGTGNASSAAKRQQEKARLQSDSLKKEGTSGSEAKDYGLLSEGEKSKNAASATTSATSDATKPLERRTATSGSGSGSSEEVDEDGAVLLKRPVT